MPQTVLAFIILAENKTTHNKRYIQLPAAGNCIYRQPLCAILQTIMDNYNFNEKKARIFFFAMIGSLLFFILIGKYFDIDLNKNHLYTKGKLIEIKGQSRSGSKRIIFQYSINNKKYTGESLFLSDSLDYYEPNIGKSFLLKMHKKHWINSVFSTYKLYIDKPIPEKIEPPQNGWKTIPIQIFVNAIHKP